MDPRSRRIASLTPEARSVFEALSLRRDVGDPLAQGEAEAVVGFYRSLIEAALEGRADFFADPVAARHLPIPFVLPTGIGEPTLTFSGGVGELIYASLAGRPLPEPAHHGDLGVDLARAILASPRLMARVATPASMGRATAYGLLRHATVTVRRRSTTMLAEQSYPRAGGLILDSLAAEADVQTRLIFVECLGRVRFRGALDALNKLADERHHPVDVRVAACAALGRIGDVRAVPVLTKLYYKG